MIFINFPLFGGIFPQIVNSVGKLRNRIINLKNYIELNFYAF